MRSASGQGSGPAPRETTRGDEVTRLLGDLSAGRPQAEEDLFRVVYQELRRIAAAQVGRLSAGQTLTPTVLVHEAYLRLIGNAAPGWSGRGHFFGAAAQAMRQIIVDGIRRKNADKRGGGRPPLALDEALAIAPSGLDPEEVLAIDAALARLQAEHPRRAKVVVMRYFAGLAEPEIAEALGVNPRTIERDWRFARAYLRQALAEEPA